MIGRSASRRFSRCLALLCAPSLIAACSPASSEKVYVGQYVANADRGRVLVAERGCGACHSIPGVRDATGTIGPPLGSFGQRRFIAGQLPNSPEHLAAWVLRPQSIKPGDVMPNVAMSERDASDIAAYLLSER